MKLGDHRFGRGGRVQGFLPWAEVLLHTGSETRWAGGGGDHRGGRCTLAVGDGGREGRGGARRGSRVSARVPHGEGGTSRGPPPWEHSPFLLYRELW